MPNEPIQGCGISHRDDTFESFRFPKNVYGYVTKHIINLMCILHEIDVYQSYYFELPPELSMDRGM